MRVRRRGRESSSIDVRARSTAAALEVPSAGTWLRRASGLGAAGLGGFADAPFVIVMAVSRSRFKPTKNPRLPARVPSVFGGGALASVPPRSSVLPPGAGNKAEKAVQPKKERAKNPDERYVVEAGVHRHGHAAAVTRHDDGNVAAVTTIEHAQSGLPQDACDPRVRAACGAVYEALHDRATRRTPPHRIVATRTLTGWQ